MAMTSLVQRLVQIVRSTLWYLQTYANNGSRVQLQCACVYWLYNDNLTQQPCACYTRILVTTSA